MLQGMKLQPCQPGFLDARDGILAADSLFYQGQYHTSIWSAFARRGMGYNAVQGASTSATDQTAGFDTPPNVSLKKPTALVFGNTFDVAIRVTCLQVPTTAYSVSDELPAGLQFVGSTTGGTLVGNKVTFANLAFTSTNQSLTLRFRAQATTAAAYALLTPVDDNQDGRTAGGFASTFLAGITAWASSSTRAFSGTQAWAATPPVTPSDYVLTSAPFTPTGLSVLSFYHYFDFEASYDGGTVELSTDNGTTWQNGEVYFIQNGPNSVFDASTTAPGERCFSGTSSSTQTFQRSVMDLRSFANSPLRIRFRVRTDDGSPGTFEGWVVDDVQVINGGGGNQRIELRTAANAVQESQTVVTYLVPATATATQTGLAKASQFSAQPNPFGSAGLRLQLSLPTAQPRVSLTLFDVAGRSLLRRTVDRPAAGPSTLAWPEAAALPAGLYLLRAQLPDGSSSTLRVVRE